MKINTLIPFLCIMICTINTIDAWSWKKMCSYVIPQKIYKHVHYEEYTLKNGTFIIKNIEGNIHVRTSGEGEKIFLKAIKKSYEEENLPLLSFTQTAHSNTITIAAQPPAEEAEGTIDFELIVPRDIALNITTQKGDIKVEKTQTPAILKSIQGDIEVIQAQNTVKATTQESGSITFYEPMATVYANAADDIYIYDAHASIIAEAEGKVESHNKEVPSTSLIKISANGPISLYLPSHVNADLHADTKYGSIISEHFVTLKPFTTQLNSAAWRKLRKEVEGSIGTGEAQIKLSSANSSIKLLEEKIS